MSFVVVKTLVAYPCMSRSRGTVTRMPDNDHICDVSDKLVNSCRPWLGARAHGYPQEPSDFGNQHSFHETRIDRRLDLVHAFADHNKLPLVDPKTVRWADRVETWLVQNWKPAKIWADATGHNSKINMRIDRAALKLHKLAPKQVFLVVHHEPENDVSLPGFGRPGAGSGKSGSAADYRAMWANVRERFDALGVDNIVWGMAYMNYPKWYPVMEELWPGDDLVDWLWFNAYGSASRPNIDVNIGEFLTKIDAIGIGAGKPKGIIEWGISRVDDHVALKYYDDAVRLLDGYGAIANPDLKAWMIFDSPGTHADGGLRVGFDDAGFDFPEKQTAYNRFAQHPVFSCRNG